MNGKLKPLQYGFTIYGADWCPYCIKAKKLVKRKKRRFKYINVEKMINTSAYIKKMKKLGATKLRYVPKIYYNAKYIGGFNELQDAILPK